MHKFFSVVVTLGVAALLVSLSSSPAAAVEGESCSERFGEREWVMMHSGPVSIEATGVYPLLAARFLEDIIRIDSWITEDIGSYTATLCLVSYEASIGFPGYEMGGHRLHAHTDLPEHLVVLNTQRIGFVAPAAAYSLAQLALWQQNGNAAFPNPIASAIGQWYRARILDRLVQYHHDQKFANMFNVEPFVDWVSLKQPAVHDWEPEQNFASIGTFIDFAVTTHGVEMLRERDGARWSQVEGEWRVFLRNDLRDRDTDTTGWMTGLALAAGSLFVALAVITAGIISKHRSKRRPATPAPIPGFFSNP